MLRKLFTAYTTPLAQPRPEQPKAPEAVVPALPPLYERPTRWPLTMPIATFGGDIFTLRDACDSVMVFGGMGSGKTSTTGKLFAEELLRIGAGVLVLCFKSEEQRAWLKYATASGRSEDVVLFGPESSHQFNFLDWTAYKCGDAAGLVENVVTLLNEITSLGAGEAAGGREDQQFWSEAKLRLLRNTVLTILLSGESLTLDRMFDVMLSAPTDEGAVYQSTWQTKSPCAQILAKIRDRLPSLSPEEAGDFPAVEQFWLVSWPREPMKTRESVAMMVKASADAFRVRPLRRLFTTDTTISPHDILRGKIVIVDLPVDRFQKVGRMAAIAWKYCMQRAIERREDLHPDPDAARPCVIFADEFQNFACATDRIYQAVAREKRGINIAITQNREGIKAAIGGANEAVVDAILNGFGTTIFHTNSSSDTNKWASDKISVSLQMVPQSSSGSNLSFGKEFSWSENSGTSASGQYLPIFQPYAFTTLRNGGAEHDRWVDAIVFRPGKIWSLTKAPYLRVSYRQEDRTATIIKT